MAARKKAQHGDGDTGRVGAALEKGKYRDFTGWILWGKTDGYVEHATFELSDDAMSVIEMIANGGANCRNVYWKDGTWINGTWGGGEWTQGTWRNGTWLTGTWQNGLWQDGTWITGRWKFGMWHGGEWKCGIWIHGLYWIEAIRQYVSTGREPFIMKLKGDKWDLEK